MALKNMSCFVGSSTPHSLHMQTNNLQYTNISIGFYKKHIFKNWEISQAPKLAKV